MLRSQIGHVITFSLVGHVCLCSRQYFNIDLIDTKLIVHLIKLPQQISLAHCFNFVELSTLYGKFNFRWFVELFRCSCFSN